MSFNSLTLATENCIISVLQAAGGSFKTRSCHNSSAEIVVQQGHVNIFSATFFARHTSSHGYEWCVHFTFYYFLFF